MSKGNFNDNHFSMDTLQKHKDKPLFEVPEHYFEQLQCDVIHKVTKEKGREKTTKKWISAISVAASFVLIVMFSTYLVINRNPNEHFYVFEEITESENTTSMLDSNHLAEATEVVANELSEVQSKTEILSSKTSSVSKETIVYRAVDFYIDDYETDRFYEVMYDLDFYYDY